MSPFLRKEVRLLLPNWTICLLAALSTWLLTIEHASSVLQESLAALPLLVCPVAAVLMAMDSFGRELSHGTFSILLTQPISRVRIWRTKTLILAAGLALVYAAWALPYLSHYHDSSQLRRVLIPEALWALAVFSGGLWTVLLFRHVVIAFGLTLAIPAGLQTLLEIALPGRYAGHFETVRIVLAIAYSAAGFLWARWLFLRAQDTAWTGGAIALPEWRGLSGREAGRCQSATHRPLFALFSKEVQLHHAELIIATLLAAMHLGVLALRTWGGNFQRYSLIEVGIECFWMLWLLLPLLVGAAAAAEERRLGTLESQLCLPANPRAQFTVKFAVVLLLSIVLGSIMPLLLEGKRVFPDMQLDLISLTETMDGSFVGSSPRLGFGFSLLLRSLAMCLPLLVLAGIAAGIATFSFFASTLSRNTLQAYLPAVLCVGAAALLGSIAPRPEVALGYALWRGPLFFLVALPPLAVCLVRLLYSNSRSLLVGWTLWRRNLLTLGGWLLIAAAATTLIYQRTWELLPSPDPPRGTPRLAEMNPIRVLSDRSKIALQMPDGRAWVGYVTLERSLWQALCGQGEHPVLKTAGQTGFLDGTNWVSVAFNTSETVGIRSDGSLWFGWLFPNPNPAAQSSNLPPSGAPPMIRFGSHNDWRSAVGFGSWHDMVFLFKTNGTLWRWATNQATGRTWPGLGAFEPQQIGSDSDWAGGFLSHHCTWFRKNDGRTWMFIEYEPSPRSRDSAIHIRPYYLVQVWVPNEPRWRCFDWWDIDGLHQVGIVEDGTLLIGSPYFKRPVDLRKWLVEPFKLDQDTNWVAVTALDLPRYAVGLKKDGSLWRFEHVDARFANPNPVRMARLGTHSDWVAVASLWNGALSLATDGSLWFWRFEREHYYGSMNHLFLAPSRRPTRLGNIFDGSG